VTLEEIVEAWPEETFLKADGFDDAIIGVDSQTMRLIYSRSQMVDILVNQGMDEDEAIEYLEFNTYCAYMGEQTPIYASV